MKSCNWLLALVASFVVVDAQWDASYSSPAIDTPVPMTTSTSSTITSTPSQPIVYSETTTTTSPPPPTVYGPPPSYTHLGPPSSSVPAYVPSPASSNAPPYYSTGIAPSYSTPTSPVASYPSTWGTDTTLITSAKSSGWGASSRLPPLPYQTRSTKTKPYVPPWLHSTWKSASKTWGPPLPSATKSQTVINYGGGWN